MGERIVISPELLDDRANQVEKCRDTQVQTFETVDSFIKHLVEGWEGEAQTAFTESFNRNKKKFDEFIVDMTNFAKFMHDFAATMRTNEAGGVRKAQQL